MALYYWRGRKPHRHFAITTVPSGKNRGKPQQVQEAFLQPGEVFEPSPAELLAFRDLLEPYADGLRADAGDEQQAELVTLET